MFFYLVCFTFIFTQYICVGTIGAGMPEVIGSVHITAHSTIISNSFHHTDDIPVIGPHMNNLRTNIKCVCEWVVVRNIKLWGVYAGLA